MHTRIAVVALCLTALLAGYQPRPASTHNANIDDYKANVIADVDKMAKQSQVMVDMVFSFGELGLPGHNWTDAIAMATPIAHKGVTAGAKVVAMTMIDLLTKPELVQQAWTYFREVQTKDTKYLPLISPDDKPQTWLNQRTMDTYRERMRKYYYDPSKYDTYLEQLGIKYPTTR